MKTRLILLLASCVAAVSAFAAPSKPSPFLAFLDRLDAAQRQLQNGDATAYEALWSHGDNVTLSGGFGGKIEKGWPDVSRRLDWAATQFSKGQNTIERVTTTRGATSATSFRSSTFDSSYRVRRSSRRATIE
jgi:hypothetical protein